MKSVVAKRKTFKLEDQHLKLSEGALLRSIKGTEAKDNAGSGLFRLPRPALEVLLWRQLVRGHGSHAGQGQVERLCRCEGHVMHSKTEPNSPLWPSQGTPTPSTVTAHRGRHHHAKYLHKRSGD